MNLSLTKVNDAALAHVKAFTKLETLELNETAVSDAGLAHLRGMTSLEALRLRKTQQPPVDLREAYTDEGKAPSS